MVQRGGREVRTISPCTLVRPFVLCLVQDAHSPAPDHQVVAILGPPVPQDNAEGHWEPREPNHTQDAVPSCVVPPRGQLPGEMRYKNLKHEGEAGVEATPTCRSSHSPSLARLPFMKMTPRITKRRLSLGVSLVLRV